MTELPCNFEYATGHFARRCDACMGHGCSHPTPTRRVECRACGGHGYFGIDPLLPTICPPGTEEAMVVKRARLSNEIEVYLPGDATLNNVSLATMDWTPTFNLGRGSNQTDAHEVANVEDD
jgi:hypothetical protein